MSPVLTQEAKLLARLAELDATAPPAPTRGARTFLVDRALEYAAISRAAASPVARRAALRRRGAARARSKGYISIMVRLGEAFRDRPDAELARYRSRRITWKLAQRVVRAGRTPAEIREALLIEATLWTPGGTRRPRDASRHSEQEPRGTRASSASVGSRSNARSNSTARAATWEHDPAWAARDPAGYLEAYERHLRSVHHTVTSDLTRGLEIRAADGDRSVGSLLRSAAQQSIRQLTASLARSAAERSAPRALASSPEAVEVLGRLAALDQALRPPLAGAREDDLVDDLVDALHDDPLDDA